MRKSIEKKQRSEDTKLSPNKVTIPIDTGIPHQVHHKELRTTATQ
jgi:hypothetical protein